MNSKILLGDQKIQKLEEYINGLEIDQRLKVMVDFEKLKNVYTKYKNFLDSGAQVPDISFAELASNDLFEEAAFFAKQKDNNEEERYFLIKAGAQAEEDNDLLKALNFYNKAGDKENADYMFEKIENSGNAQDLLNAYIAIGDEKKALETLKAAAIEAEETKNYFDAATYYNQMDNSEKATAMLLQAKSWARAKSDWGKLISICDMLGDKEGVKEACQLAIEDAHLFDELYKAASYQIEIKDWEGLDKTINLLLEEEDWQTISNIIKELDIENRKRIFLPLVDKMYEIMPIWSFLNILDYLNAKEEKVRYEKTFLNDYLNNKEHTNQENVGFLKVISSTNEESLDEDAINTLSKINFDPTHLEDREKTNLYEILINFYFTKIRKQSTSWQ